MYFQAKNRFLPGPPGPFLLIFLVFCQESGLGTPSMEISESRSPRGLIESQIGWKKRNFKPKTGLPHQKQFFQANTSFFGRGWVPGRLLGDPIAATEFRPPYKESNAIKTNIGKI